MNKLQSQLQRLYLSTPGSEQAQGSLIDQQGHSRALVLELARPADWEALFQLWRAVQVDLDLPAPAIAVSGVDGFQLWFSLAQPLSIELAQAFLRSLCARYLPDVANNRLRLMPTADNATCHAQCAPMQAHSGSWSAYVTAELAPLFADTPWIEVEPGSDGQAGVLSRLQSISLAAFAAASRQLGLDTTEFAAPTPTLAPAIVSKQSVDAPSLDPKRFLQQIMNDESVALALRIEAAKALLPYAGEYPG